MWAGKKWNACCGSEFGQRHLGGFDEGDDLGADGQLQLFQGTGRDHRGDDARRGLDVDFGQDRAGDDFLDGATELVAGVDGFDAHVSAPSISNENRLVGSDGAPLTRRSGKWVKESSSPAAAPEYKGGDLP